MKSRLASACGRWWLLLSVAALLSACGDQSDSQDKIRPTLAAKPAVGTESAAPVSPAVSTLTPVRSTPTRLAATPTQTAAETETPVPLSPAPHTTGTSSVAASTGTWVNPTVAQVTRTRSPTPAALASAPLLMVPNQEAKVEGDAVVFRWKWDRQLAADEYFDVRVWPLDHDPQSIGWEKSEWHEVRGLPGGKYSWSITVIIHTGTRPEHQGVETGEPGQ